MFEPTSLLVPTATVYRTSGTADAVDNADAGPHLRSAAATSEYTRSRGGVLQLAAGGQRRRRATADERQTADARRDADPAVERTTRHTLVLSSYSRTLQKSTAQNA